MKTYSVKIIILFSLIIFIASCVRKTCENTNPIFAQMPPEDKEYKDELIKQFDKIDKEKLKFTLEDYYRVSNRECICVNVQGEGLCAKIVLEIGKSKKGIENILENKGKGYIGAEFKDLKFDIKKDSTETKFVFKEISGIVD